MKLAFATRPNDGLMSGHWRYRVTVWGNDLDKYHPGVQSSFGGPQWIEFETAKDAANWAAEAGFGLVQIPDGWDSLTLAQCLRFASGKADGGGVLEPWCTHLE